MASGSADAMLGLNPVVGFKAAQLSAYLQQFVAVSPFSSRPWLHRLRRPALVVLRAGQAGHLLTRFLQAPGASDA